MSCLAMSPSKNVLEESLAFAAVHPDYMILLRTYVSRPAVGKGRAVLEGVGLDSSEIEECFTKHLLNEEEAVQAGLTKWSRGHGRLPNTWVVLLAAMEYATIAHAHVHHLKDALARGMLFTLVNGVQKVYICTFVSALVCTYVNELVCVSGSVYACASVHVRIILYPVC